MKFLFLGPVLSMGMIAPQADSFLGRNRDIQNRKAKLDLAMESFKIAESVWQMAPGAYGMKDKAFVNMQQSVDVVVKANKNLMDSL